MKNILLTLLICICFLYAHSQEEETKTYSPFVSAILQKNPKSNNYINTFPTLSFGTGILAFHGDIRSTTSHQNCADGFLGIHFELSQPIRSNYAFGLRYVRGTLYGEKYFPGTNVAFNFQSQISAYSAFVTYNFETLRFLYPYHLRSISPYCSVGLEVMQTPEAWSDYKNGSQHLYAWSDGTFRNIPEDPTTAYQSEILYRDYKYETSYASQNKNTPLVLAMPFEIGAEVRLSPKITMNIGYQYHMSFSNSLDNINKRNELYSQANKQKSSWVPDGFSYIYASISINIHNKAYDMYADALPYNAAEYDMWDADGDGVPETIDKCPYTPKGVEVDAFGCPLDSDNDGVPDYRDIEQKPCDFYCNELGKNVLREELIFRMKSENPILQNEIYRYYPALLNGGTAYRQFYKKIPQKFKNIDSDKNQYIDIEELLSGIDSFFDQGPDAGAGSYLSVKDLFELIEFFFLQ
ncbi:MAG: thrombospondin type 3 repeat-containing protein [Bacteroidales bacterium]|nr:thrombospondin type 3 repeat-containing protein [Bacteroidales bacterium]